MSYQVQIKTVDTAVVVSVTEEVLTKDADGNITHRKHDNSEHFVPAGCEFAVFADENTRYINVNPVLAGQKGLVDYNSLSAAQALVTKAPVDKEP